ncbi:MAG: hypothetical protein JSS98_12470 [Bacteroidetes bacterium]|nr:hypothetical protein [Bacteroidota bacterium]
MTKTGWDCFVPRNDDTKVAMTVAGVAMTVQGWVVMQLTGGEHSPG